MVKRSFCFLLALVLLASAFSVVAYADNRDLIVYYAVGSKSAYCYHKKPDCPSLSRSTVGELTLEEAATRGYTPCSRCHPPAPDFEVLATPRPETGGGGESFSSRTFSTPAPSAAPYNSPSYEPFPSPTTKPESNTTSRYRRNNLKNFLPPAIMLSFFAVIILYSYFSSLVLGIKEKKRSASSFSKIEDQTIPEISQNFEPVKNELDKEAGLLPEPHIQNTVFSSSSVITFDDKKEKLPEKTKQPNSNIAENCYIGDDGLPACKDGPERWGDGYTFYMTARGRMYHTRYCKVGLRSPFHAVNAYTAKTGFRYYDGPHYYKPCSYCKPELPDLTWYENVKRGGAYSRGLDK